MLNEEEARKKVRDSPLKGFLDSLPGKSGGEEEKDGNAETVRENGRDAERSG